MEKMKSGLTKEQLVKLYWDNELATTQIAQMYDISKGQVSLLAKEYGVALRGKSEASRLAIRKGRKPKPNNKKQQQISEIQDELSVMPDNAPTVKATVIAESYLRLSDSLNVIINELNKMNQIIKEGF